MSVVLSDRTKLQLDISSENKGAVSFWIGAPVAAHGSGSGCLLADATTLSHRVIGLATLGVNVGFAECIRTEGWFELFDWTQVIGSQLLSPNTIYFLSLTPGKLTAIAPVTGIDQRVGVSVSTTLMQLNIGGPIAL